jgi:hypothetical protein
VGVPLFFILETKEYVVFLLSLIIKEYIMSIKLESNMFTNSYIFFVSFNVFEYGNLSCKNVYVLKAGY